MDSSVGTPLSARINFSPVRVEDFDELVELRIAAMRESLERVGRFDPARARERLKKSFFPEQTEFIRLDDRKIGFYTLRPIAEGLRLEHLYVHPDNQSRGIGSQVLNRLLAVSDKSRLPVHLGALRESRSNEFYRRHGFTKTKENEWDIYYVRPAAPPEIPS